MKSVMEEAPSIAKAVEQAWERVGKPREFTVKIFEEAKKSFFGFTKQSAKIALVFDERTLTEKPKTTVERPVSTKALSNRSKEQKQKFKRPSQKDRPAHPEYREAMNRRMDRQKPTPRQQPTKERKPQREISQRSAQASAFTKASPDRSEGIQDKQLAQTNKQKSLWDDKMVNNARTWVEQNLKIIGLPNIKFNTSTQKYHLRFQFETCVLENREKEKKLFSAFAHLIMATMRSKFKKEFRGLKVVLSSD